MNYYKPFENLKSAGFTPDTIFDVGAAYGYWSEELLKVYPKSRYELFEPLSRIYEKYTNQQECFKKKYTNFTFHPVALGSHNGISQMSVAQDGWSSSLIEVKNQDFFDKTQMVKTYRIDDYVNKLSLPLPDIIKMDTQGYELEIIKGGKRIFGEAKIVFTEFWFYRGYGPKTALFNELISELNDLGFVLVELVGLHYGNLRDLSSGDALFMKRDFLKDIKNKMPSGAWY